MSEAMAGEKEMAILILKEYIKLIEILEESFGK